MAKTQKLSLWDPALVGSAALDSFRKLIRA